MEGRANRPHRCPYSGTVSFTVPCHALKRPVRRRIPRGVRRLEPRLSRSRRRSWVGEGDSNPLPAKGGGC